jgi:hypothetical protein
MLEQCRASLNLHGEVDICPELVFKNGRYWCNLMETKPELVKDMMGKGCGAPWNKFRKNVKKRTIEEYRDYYDEEVLSDLVRYYDSRRKKKKD